MRTLLEQKAYLQSELKNLEHDYTLDRLDKASFESMQAELQKNLNHTIQQIEKMMGMKYSKLAENLRDQLRGEVTNEAKLNYCPQCGQTFTRSDRYCSQCGFKLGD
jgi:rubrerythrin